MAKERRIFVMLAAGGSSFREELMMADEREMWEEWTTNGANSHLEAITFDHFHRDITCRTTELAVYNKLDDNAHFIYGFVESLMQSDSAPAFLHERWNEVTIQVTHED